MPKRLPLRATSVRYSATPLAGVFVIDVTPHVDDRGSFARIYCAEEFADQGLETAVAQCNLSSNAQQGTIRGLHYQMDPGAEAKLVRCVRGAIVDVAVDVRADSPTYLRHISVELSDTNRRALYIPEGCAHGYQALQDDTEVLYQVSRPYRPELERGLRYDDPALGIAWPLSVTAVSDKDRRWPLVGGQV
jgi:dTDP-4-dehydrorhamnose 3,5-epimerase